MVLAKVARIDGTGRVLASVALTLALVMLARLPRLLGVPVVVLAKVARIDGAGRVLASVALTLALVMLAAVAQTVDSHQVFLLHHVILFPLCEKSSSVCFLWLL